MRQNTLVNIKRMIISDRYVFTKKAEIEMFIDGLTEEDVLESILNANGIKKVLRSTSSNASQGEKLYVIESQECPANIVFIGEKVSRGEPVEP